MPTDAHIREAFAEVARGLMEWNDPAVMSPREYRNREGIRNIYRPSDKQGETEPYDIDLDATEHGI